jgi:hypothetical protein
VVSSILGTSQSLVGSCEDCTAGGEALHGKRFKNIEEVSNEVTREIRRISNEGVLTAIQDLPKRWTAVIKHNGDDIEGLEMYFVK